MGMDVKHSTGNIVNNILINVLSDGVKIYNWDDHLVIYVMSNHCGVHLKLIYCNNICQT